MRILVSLCFILLSSLGLAQSLLPAGCQSVAVKGEALTLKSKKAHLIFIHNITKMDLWVTHPVSDSGASAGWASRLQTENWSALVVGKPTFVLTCIESKPGHEQQLPCEGAIEVCQWPDVKVPHDQHKNTFWVSEDKPLEALKAAVSDRGITLPEGK